MVGSISLEVVFRYFINMPLSWCEELARFATIWMSFIGTAIAYRHRDLVMMTVIDKIAGERLRILCNLMASVLALLFFGVLIYGEIELQEIASASKSLALGIPMNVWSVVILFSGASMVFSAIRHISSDLQKLRNCSKST
jgi:TRAP-type transport system small permease protein